MTRFDCCAALNTQMETQVMYLGFMTFTLSKFDKNRKTRQQTCERMCGEHAGSETMK